MQYKEGTVNVTNASANIVGVGTSWLANVAIGSTFSVLASGVSYQVANVVDDTHITLASNYGGSTETGLAYAITTSFSPNRGWPIFEFGDVDTPTLWKRLVNALDNLFGGVFGASRLVTTDANGNLQAPAAASHSGSLGLVGGALNEAQGSDVASAGTVNLDTATGNVVDVTGTTTITAITLSQGRERTVRFTGSLVVTNGASLVLPGSANIQTAAGDFAVFRGYAAGVVRCVAFNRLQRNGANVASAATINLNAATGDLVDVTGTTTITAVTLAQGRDAMVRFTGALTLTNGASLVLPGAANITTAAGDYAVFRGYASGVVRLVHYLISAVVPFDRRAPGAIGGTTPGAITGTTITATGLLDISGAGAGQIRFPATQNPSANANTLDDFERGTWTLTLSDGTNNATMAANDGRYRKIADLVYINGDAETSSLGSVSGAIRITGLPFTPISGGLAPLTASNANALAITAPQSVAADIVGSNTFITLRLWDSNVGNTTMQHSEWSSDGSLSVGGCYIAA